MMTLSESEVVFQQHFHESYTKLANKTFLTSGDVWAWLNRQTRAYSRDVMQGTCTLPSFNRYTLRPRMGLFAGVPHIELKGSMDYEKGPDPLIGLGRFYKLCPSMKVYPRIYNNQLSVKCLLNLADWPPLVVSEMATNFYYGLVAKDDCPYYVDRPDELRKEYLAQGKFLLHTFYPDIPFKTILLAVDLDMIARDGSKFAEWFTALSSQSSGVTVSRGEITLTNERGRYLPDDLA